jgi:hypothetical protein
MTTLLPFTDWSGLSVVVTGPSARGMISGCRLFLSAGLISLLPCASRICGGGKIGIHVGAEMTWRSVHHVG